MSTTTNKAIAIKYGQDTWSGKDLGYVFEFALDTLNRGAMIQWLSQYPGEAEVLFGPLTGMDVLKEGKIHVEGATLRHLHFRPTCNQRAVRIEELVQQRKRLHLGTGGLSVMPTRAVLVFEKSCVVPS